MSIALSDEEVYERLTKPIKQGAAQARHLSALLGCEIKRRPDGHPIVTSNMLDRLVTTDKTARNDDGLNWGTG